MKVISGKLTKGDPRSAGFDIHASEDCMIYPNDSVSVPTNLRVEFPKGWMGFVKARSGSSFKYHIETGAGVVDEMYRGEIKVKLYNNSSHVPYKINKGDRVAQLVLLPFYTGEVAMPDGETLDVIHDERGEKGFGASGK